MRTRRLLQAVGDRHTFQIYSIVFVCLKWLVISLTVFLPSYLLMAPTFTCGTETYVSELSACPRIAECKIQNPLTITAHMGLYCDDLYLRNLILSAEFAGSIIGLVLLSILADQVGRKAIIVCTLCITAIGALLLTIGLQIKFVWLLFVGIIMMGFGGYSLSMVSYSYLSEVNCDSWRQRSFILTYSFWAIGEMMLYPIITYLRDWESICFYIWIVPLLVLLVMATFTVETPQFLAEKDRIEECLDSLNSIAKWNRKPQLQLRTLYTQLEPTTTDNAEPVSLNHTFTRLEYLIPLLVLSFAQTCNNGYYYTIQYSLDVYGYGLQINMLAIGTIELISCLVTNHYCKRMPRKLWIILVMCVSGAFGVLVQLTGATEALELVFIGLSRLLNTVGFALFSLICSQSFPTAIKSTGMGITEAMSNLGNMAAPFLVLFANTVGVQAVLVGGLANIAGGVSMFLVKETRVVAKKQSDTKEALLGEGSQSRVEEEDEVGNGQSEK